MDFVCDNVFVLCDWLTEDFLLDLISSGSVFESVWSRVVVLELLFSFCKLWHFERFSSCELGLLPGSVEDPFMLLLLHGERRLKLLRLEGVGGENGYFRKLAVVSNCGG